MVMSFEGDGHHDPSIYQRLTHVEADTAALKTDVSYIRAAVDSFREAAQPKWQAYAAWATLVIVVIGAFATGYIDDIQRTRNEVRTLVIQAAKAETKAEMLERQMQSNEESLKREMRLLDELHRKRNSESGGR